MSLSVFLPALRRQCGRVPAIADAIPLQRWDAARSCFTAGPREDRVALVLELGFVLNTALSVDDHDQVLTALEAIPRALGHETTAQLLCLSREADAERFLVRYDARIDTSEDPTTHRSRRAHSEHYRRAIQGDGFAGIRPRRLSLYAVLARPVPSLALAIAAPGGRGRSAGLDRAAVAVEAETRRFEDAAREVGLPTHRLTPAEVLDLLRRMLTPGVEHRAAPAYDPDLPFGAQLGLTRVFRACDQVTVDARPIAGIRHYRVLSLIERPPVVEAGVALRFLDLAGDWWLSLGWHRPEADRVMRELTQKQILANRINLGLVDTNAELFEESASTYRKSGVGHGFVRGSLHLVLGAATEAELAQRVTTATSAWQRLRFGLAPERWAATEALRQSLPGGYRPRVDRQFLGRELTYATHQVVTLFPIVKEPERFAANADHLFLSMQGEPAHVSLLGEGTPPHGFIVGRTGAGKSVLAAALMSTSLGLGDPTSGRSRPACQVVIDIRRTYERLAAFLGGGYYELRLGGDFCLNPFHLPVLDREGAPLEDRLAFQQALFLAMVEGRHDRLTRAQAGVLKELLIRTHQRFLERPTRPTLSDVLQTLTDPTFLDRVGASVRTFGAEVRLMVKDFTREGTYGRLVDGPNRLSLGAGQYDVFNVAGLKEHPELQALVVRTLVYAIQQRVEQAFAEGRRSRIWLDEAWSLLQTSSEAASFLHEAYRAYRHLGAGIVCITQQPGDLRGDAGETIRSNSGTSMFLAMTRDQIALCQAPLRLTDGEAAAIERLRTVPGTYAEFFVRAGDSMRGTLRYPCPPEIYWLCATEADDMRALEAALDRHRGDMRVAVAWLAEHHPNGARGVRREAAA